MRIANDVIGPLPPVSAPEVPFADRVRHMSDERIDQVIARKEKRDPNDPDLAVLKAEQSLRTELSAGPLPKYAHHIRRMSDEQLAGEMKRVASHPDRKQAEAKMKLLQAEQVRRQPAPAAADDSAAPPTPPQTPPAPVIAGPADGFDEPDATGKRQHGLQLGHRLGRGHRGRKALDCHGGASMFDDAA